MVAVSSGLSLLKPEKGKMGNQYDTNIRARGHVSHGNENGSSSVFLSPRQPSIIQQRLEMFLTNHVVAQRRDQSGRSGT